MVALRQGVDDLERQKQKYIDEAAKAQKERDIADMASHNYRVQMETASERNIALVKKCEGYVEENKAIKEKYTLKLIFNLMKCYILDSQLLKLN